MEELLARLKNTDTQDLLEILRGLSGIKKLERITEMNTACINMMSTYHNFLSKRISKEQFDRLNEICFEVYVLSVTAGEQEYDTKVDVLTAEYETILSGVKKSKDELEKMN